jgi:ribosomal protein S18 acetylase RimI-like enzyme
MPKIRRRGLPEKLLLHLVKRVRERHISEEQLVVLARWLDSEPDVPEGKWFKRFAGFTLCGEGELIKTFLLTGQAPDGMEMQ